MDYSPPGSSVHGILQAKNTGVGCHALLQGIFQPRDCTPASCIAGGFFTINATWEAPMRLDRLIKYHTVLETDQN